MREKEQNLVQELASVERSLQKLRDEEVKTQDELKSTRENMDSVRQDLTERHSKVQQFISFLSFARSCVMEEISVLEVRLQALRSMDFQDLEEAVEDFAKPFRTMTRRLEEELERLSKAVDNLRSVIFNIGKSKAFHSAVLGASREKGAYGELPQDLINFAGQLLSSTEEAPKDVDEHLLRFYEMLQVPLIQKDSEKINVPSSDGISQKGVSSEIGDEHYLSTIKHNIVKSSALLDENKREILRLVESGVEKFLFLFGTTLGLSEGVVGGVGSNRRDKKESMAASPGGFFDFSDDRNELLGGLEDELLGDLEDEYVEEREFVREGESHSEVGQEWDSKAVLDGDGALGSPAAAQAPEVQGHVEEGAELCEVLLRLLKTSSTALEYLIEMTAQPLSTLLLQIRALVEQSRMAIESTSASKSRATPVVALLRENLSGEALALLSRQQNKNIDSQFSMLESYFGSISEETAEALNDRGNVWIRAAISLSLTNNIIQFILDPAMMSFVKHDELHPERSLQGHRDSAEKALFGSTGSWFIDASEEPVKKEGFINAVNGAMTALTASAQSMPAIAENLFSLQQSSVEQISWSLNFASSRGDYLKAQYLQGRLERARVYFGEVLQWCSAIESDVSRHFGLLGFLLSPTFSEAMEGDSESDVGSRAVNKGSKDSKAAFKRSWLSNVICSVVNTLSSYVQARRRCRISEKSFERAEQEAESLKKRGRQLAAQHASASEAHESFTALDVMSRVKDAKSRLDGIFLHLLRKIEEAVSAFEELVESKTSPSVGEVLISLCLLDYYGCLSCLCREVQSPEDDGQDNLTQIEGFSEKFTLFVSGLCSLIVAAKRLWNAAETDEEKRSATRHFFDTEVVCHYLLWRLAEKCSALRIQFSALVIPGQRLYVVHSILKHFASGEPDTKHSRKSRSIAGNDERVGPFVRLNNAKDILKIERAKNGMIQQLQLCVNMQKVASATPRHWQNAVQSRLLLGDYKEPSEIFGDRHAHLGRPYRAQGARMIEDAFSNLVHVAKDASLLSQMFVGWTPWL